MFSVLLLLQRSEQHSRYFTFQIDNYKEQSPNTQAAENTLFPNNKWEDVSEQWTQGLELETFEPAPFEQVYGDFYSASYM